MSPGGGASRTRSPLLDLVLVAALVGCEVPTESPILESRWIVPVEGSRIGLDEFLPEGVTIEESAFTVELTPGSDEQSLGEMCSACQPLDGLLAPKPAFTATLEFEGELPAEVEAAALEMGSVTVRATHDLSFDPLRPGGDATGTMSLELEDAATGRVLAEIVVAGTTTAFPAGPELVRTVALDAGDLGATVRISAVLDSPEGDPAVIDTSDRLEITADPATFTASAATVEVTGREVELTGAELDTEDVDESVVEDVVEGAIELGVANPFGVGVDATLVIDGPTFEPITKPLVVAPEASSEVRVEFTGPELRRFLGQPDVTLGGSGTVQGGPDVITVTPLQELVFTTRIDATLQIGG